MMSENSKIVLEFVKANDGKNLTAADIALQISLKEQD